MNWRTPRFVRTNSRRFLALAGMLNLMRIGQVNPAIVDVFTGLKRPVVLEEGWEPVEL